MQLKPETERLVQEEIRSGHFDSVDELIVKGIHAWREKNRIEPTTVPSKPRKRLYDLLTQPPFAWMIPRAAIAVRRESSPHPAKNGRV